MQRNTALILFAWSAAACLVNGGVAWSMDRREAATPAQTEQSSIAPGDVHEVCLGLSVRDTLHYAFTATGKLRFNIHYHAGNEIHFPVPEYETPEAKGAFTPALDQDYCLMWTNPGPAPVRLRLEYQKRAGAK